jgi:hypothetical protein
MWSPNQDGTGAAWALANGRLELSIAPGGSPGGRYNMISVAFGSQCRFNSDFDARVDYQLLDWPDANGTRVQLSAWIFPNPNSDTARSSTQYGESYSGDIASTWKGLPTNDQHGTLRVARANGVMTSYVLLPNGKWYSLNSGTAAGQVMIGLQIFAMASDWAHKQVRIAFDNFSVSAPSVTCQ